MEVKVTILKTFSEGNMLAVANIELAKAIIIHDVKLVDGKNGRFVSYPSREYKNKEGETKHVDNIVISDKELRQKIENAVNTTYQTFINTEAQVIDEEDDDPEFAAQN